MSRTNNLSLFRCLIKKLKTPKANPSRNCRNHFDVFINHRRIDTNDMFAGLLYDDLVRSNRNPFLDNKNMKPGDKLFENIGRAIQNAKVAVAVFSPTYCRSYFCLHELSLITESRKPIIPIFCDVKPSQLRVMIRKPKCTEDEIRRFGWALEEAKHTVGITFNSLKGNWSEVVTEASEIIIEKLIEVEAEEIMSCNSPLPF